MEAKKRNVLTIQQKLNILRDLETGISNSELCVKYKLPKSTISTIYKNKDKIKSSSLNINVAKLKKIRKPVRTDVDRALLKWFTIQRSQNNPITGAILQTKAEELARVSSSGSNSQEFVCTKGWLDRFKTRYNINAGKIHGESACVSVETTSEWLKGKWLEICKDYDANDIFNGDETGLFYKMLPDKTLKFKGEKCSGGKQSKERLTVWVCANMTGSEKRPLTVIGKFKSPRCFKNFSGKLPVNYLSNKRAWVTSEIFQALLHDWDNELRKKNRKIVLIVDNCPAHPRLENLQNINLVFLPPNVTAVLQPMDQGVIRCLKSYYRKQFLVQLISSLENKENFKFTILDAILMISASWRKVSQKTIANCFRHAGFKIQPIIAEEEEEDDLPLAQWIELHRYNESTDESGDEDNRPLATWIQENKVSLDAYVAIDENLITSEVPSDAEIVASSSDQPSIIVDEESEDEVEEINDESEFPSVTESLAALNTVSKFLHNCNAETTVFKAYDKLYRYIEKQVFVKNKVQNKLTAYFPLQNT